MRVPSRAHCRIVLFFVALVVAGCGSSEREAGSDGTRERVEISVVAADPEPEGPLPPGMCFVATRNLELVITVAERAPAGLCERLAAYLPPAAGRAPWPPRLQEDEVLNAGCAVQRDGARIEVGELPDRGDGRLDSLDICDEMVRDAWELKPLVELVGDEEPAPGTCYVASARYELELGAATNRGQTLCEELAELHLTVPVAHRVPPVATDPQYLGYGDIACEATRGGDRVQVMHLTDERGTRDAQGACDSLAQGGWKVALWARAGRSG